MNLGRTIVFVGATSGLGRIAVRRLAADGHDLVLVAYSRSKLANLMFGYELQHRYPELTVVALHPGTVRTSLGRDFPASRSPSCTPRAGPARHGAAPVAYLATTADIKAGAYYDRFTRCGPRQSPMTGRPRVACGTSPSNCAGRSPAEVGRCNF